MTPGPSLDQLTREIFHFEDQAIEHAESAVKFKAEIGKRLIAAKELLPHGHFMPWAEKQFGWSHRHVTNHMELARKWKRVSTLPEGASLRMALSAVAGSNDSPAPKVEHNKFVIPLLSGEEAVVELRTGDPEQLCATFDARSLTFRRLRKAA